MYRDVAILTKSSKNKGYCVAGIDTQSGRWIRLVSSDTETHGSLQNKHMQYEDGGFCRILDVVRVQVKSDCPLPHQPENVLIDEQYFWKKIGECSLRDILKAHPPEIHDFIFGNLNCYITEDEIDSIGYSLMLIEVTQLVISQVQNSFGKRKTKASFRYGHHCYNLLSVTDPSYYNVEDQTKLDKALLIVSLPDAPLPENQYFKFIAQIYI
jgi:hypothetical protein